MEDSTQEQEAVNHGFDDRPSFEDRFDDQDLTVTAPGGGVADIEAARQRRAEQIAQMGIPDALSSEHMAKALLRGLTSMEREAARKQAKQAKHTAVATQSDQAASPLAGPSLSLRYARHFAACEEIRVGGGRKGRTVYVCMSGTVLKRGGWLRMIMRHEAMPLIGLRTQRQTKPTPTWEASV